MTDHAIAGKPRSESDKPKGAVRADSAPAKAPPGDEKDLPSAHEPVPVNQLSPEEQMARFEKELKEKDWGHQPC